MTALDALAAFLAENKARSACLSRDDGYGSSPWCCEIRLEQVAGRKVVVVAVEDSEESGWSRRDPDQYVHRVWDRKSDDWPGPEAVVRAAVEQARRFVEDPPRRTT